jgi:hypothetical protein
VSTGLQLTGLLSRFDHATAEYLAGPGWHQIFAYLAVTVLACKYLTALLATAFVFLAAGIFFSKPDYSNGGRFGLGRN